MSKTLPRYTSPEPEVCCDFTECSLPPEMEFTRSSIATVIDYSGVVQHCLEDEARFQGARRVENLIKESQNLRNWNTNPNCKIVGSNIVEFNGTDINANVNWIWDETGEASVGQQFQWRVRFKIDRARDVRINWGQTPWIAKNTTIISAEANKIYDLCGLVPTDVAGDGSIDFRLVIYGSYSNTVAGDLLEIFYAQVENVTTRTNKNPSEYVSNGLGENHGCGSCDGVQYFSYENGNTVDVDGVITEGKGEPLLEKTRTVENIVTVSEDLDDWNYWTRFNLEGMTLAPDFPGECSKAFFMQENSTLNTHYLRQPTTEIPANADVMISFFIKDATGNRFLTLTGMGLDNANDNIYINPVDGTITPNPNFTGTKQFEYGISKRANGWWRVFMHNRHSVAHYIGIRLTNAPDPSGQTYQGDGVSGMYLAGVQIEIIDGREDQNPSEYVYNYSFVNPEDTGSKTFIYANNNRFIEPDKFIEEKGEAYKSIVDGMLNEPPELNFIRRSTDFTHSAWTKENCSTGTGGLAPDGSVAATLIDDTSGLTHRIKQTTSNELEASTEYVISIYVKFLSDKKLQVNGYDSTDTTWAGAAFNTDGTLFSLSVGIEAGSESLNNGWYRVWLKALKPSTTTTTILYSAGVYQGDESATLELWGPQCEKGPRISSHMPSLEGADTRARDQLTYINPHTFTDDYINFAYVFRFIPLKNNTEYEVTEVRFCNTNDSRGTDYEFRTYGSSWYSNNFYTGGGSIAYIDRNKLPIGVEKCHGYSIDQTGDQRFSRSFIDGKLKATASETLADPNWTDQNIFIGNWNSDSTVFECIIKHFAFFRDKVTDAQYSHLTRVDRKIECFSGIEPDIALDFKNAKLPYGVVHKRDSIATFINNEGLVEVVGVDEPRFDGARRVMNLSRDGFPTDIAENWKTNMASGITVSGDEITFPEANNSFTHDPLISNLAGRTFILSIEIESTIDTQINFEMKANDNSEFGSIRIDVYTGTFRYSHIKKFVGNPTETANINATIHTWSLTGNTYPLIIKARKFMFEEVTDRINQNPSEYVSKGCQEFHGSGVDGVKYFNYENTNTAQEFNSGFINEPFGINYITDSEGFYSPWQGHDATWELYYDVLPDGSTNTDGLPIIIKENEVNGDHRNEILNFGVIQQDSTYTFSCFANNLGYRNRFLSIGVFTKGSTQNVIGIYNLDTGKIEATGTDDINLRIDGYGIKPIVNGWFRCWITFTRLTTLELNEQSIHIGMSDVPFIKNQTSFVFNLYQGDGVSSVAAWGIQFEESPYLTSYIPSKSVQGIRKPDLLTYDGIKIDDKFTAVFDSTPIGNGPPNFFKAEGFNPLIAADIDDFGFDESTNTFQIPETLDSRFAFSLEQQGTNLVSRICESGFERYSDSVEDSFNLGNDHIIQIGRRDEDTFPCILYSFYAYAREISDSFLKHLSKRPSETYYDRYAPESNLPPYYIKGDFENATLIPKSENGSPEPSYSFSRGSIATVTDFEGVVHVCENDEVRFINARRVKNLVSSSEDISQVWSPYNATISGTDTITFNSDASSRIQQQYTDFSIPANSICIFRFEAQAASGSEFVRVWAGSDWSADIAINDTWRTYSAKVGISDAPWIRIYNGSDGLTRTVQLRKIQVEVIKGSQTNTNPSEYVSNGAGDDHGCNVDGVKYFAYKNGNMVDENGIVTEKAGGLLYNVGYLSEVASKNQMPYSEDFSKWTQQSTSASTYGYHSHFGDIEMTKYEMTANSGGATGFLQGISGLVGVEITCSVYSRRDYHQYIRLNGFGNGTEGVVFDVHNLIVYNNKWTSGAIEVINDNVVRCLGVVTPATTSTYYVCMCNSPSGANGSMVAGEEFVFGGAHLSLGNKLQSYIPSYGTAADRFNDVIEYNDVNVNSDFNIICDFTPTADGVDQTDLRLFSTNDSRGDDSELRTSIGTNAYDWTSASGGGVWNLNGGSDFFRGERELLGFQYQSDKRKYVGRVFGEGEILSEDSSTVKPAHNNLNLLTLCNWNQSATDIIDCIFHSFTLYDQSMSNDQMKMLTRKK